MQHLIVKLKLTILFLLKGLAHLIEVLLPFVAAALILAIGVFLWQKAIKLIRSENVKQRVAGGLMIILALLYTIGSLVPLFSLFLVVIGYPESVRD